MATLRYLTCDVFSDRRFGGNPLAVFPAADGLSASTMQAIANELNLSETVFIVAPDHPRADLRFRIFTPRSEMPFAGHPTVGGAVTAAGEGRVSGSAVVVEEQVGLVPVEIHRRHGVAVGATLQAAEDPSRTGEVPASSMARVLRLDSASVSSGQVWSCGLPFVIAEVASVDHLAAIDIDLQAMRSELGTLATRDVYAVCASGEDFRARMFAPEDGIAEDAATGSAACAFAGWWAANHGPPDGHRRVVLRQGIEMGRPSELRVGLEIVAGQARSVTVGGDVVPVAEATLAL